METDNKSAKFRAGTYFELPQNLGPIPKGVYRLGECDSCSAEFFPGDKSVFSIIGNWQDKVKPVPHSQARLIKTSQSDFIGRYYELLNEIRAKPEPSEKSDVFTMCFLDPSVCQGFH